MIGKKNKVGVVYSTDPNYAYQHENLGEQPDTLQPEKQNLRVQLDTKSRAGKQVTLVTGWVGKEEDLEALCKQLKSLCGVGGSAKDQVIIIQGDQREKITNSLIKKGYKVKRI